MKNTLIQIMYKGKEFTKIKYERGEGYVQTRVVN